MDHLNQKWLIGIDRGGTFTDVVAQSPRGELITFKLLSEDPDRYADAAIYAIHILLNIPLSEKLPESSIHSIRMGTTVATNALLERKGTRVCLVTTRGFKDILKIGYQSRQRLFDLNIQKPTQLYESVLEIDERIDNHGKVLLAPNPKTIRPQLIRIFEQGIRSLAVVLLNSYLNDAHEKLIADIAHQIGFDLLDNLFQIIELFIDFDELFLADHIVQDRPQPRFLAAGLFGKLFYTGWHIALF